jgi:phage RecT family recombinase
MAKQKEQLKEDGVETPPGFFNEEDVNTSTSTETPAATMPQDTTPPVVQQQNAQVPATTVSNQAAVITRDKIRSVKDVFAALPTQFTEMKMEGRRVTVELGFAAQIIRANPALEKCDPKTIYDAVIYSARIGTTLNPAQGQAYLVPRKGKCCLDVGYKGWRATLVSYGAIRHVDAYVVRDGDDYLWNPAEGKLRHIPKGSGSEAEHKSRRVVCAYSRAILPSGDVVFEVIEAWELDKIKNTSPAVSSGAQTPYDSWEDEMIRKAPIKRHAKKLQVLQSDDRMAALFENEKRNDEPNSAGFTDYEDVTNQTR